MFGICFKKINSSALIFLSLVLFFSCKSKPEPVIVIKDPLVLTEIAPLPKTAVVKAEVEYEPVYQVLKVIEVSEENGVQKYMMVKIGEDKTGIVTGTKGDIAEDPEFAKIIGSYKIAEVYKDFFMASIEVLTYKIGTSAYIRIKIGEKIKGE